MSNKIKFGQFYTTTNVFKDNTVFKLFMDTYQLWDYKVLEPFAGTNNLVRYYQQLNPHCTYLSYDINPKADDVNYHDSINDWNYDNNALIITNPPYLAKHSASKMRLDVDFKQYDDLYKLSLDRCLSHNRFSIVIIPTTFINGHCKVDQALINKLVYFQLLPSNETFQDTTHPVALAYFDRDKESTDFMLYEHNTLIGSYQHLQALQQTILAPCNELDIKFNVQGGNLCINTGDNTKNLTGIKFYDSTWKDDETVKNTDRHKVKLAVNYAVNPTFIEQLNEKITALRTNHCDYLWACFKTTAQTGHYRRRLDFETIKQIIHSIKL